MLHAAQNVCCFPQTIDCDKRNRQNVDDSFFSLEKKVDFVCHYRERKKNLLLFVLGRKESVTLIFPLTNAVFLRKLNGRK